MPSEDIYVHNAHTFIKRNSCCVRKRTLVQLKCLITERMPNASPSELGNTLKKLGNLVLSFRTSEYTEPVICRRDTLYYSIFKVCTC